MWLRRFIWFAVLLLVLGVVAAACDDEDEEEVPDAETPEAIVVPELTDGVLQVGSDIAYAPIEFFQEGTEIADGLDIDLGNALAAEMGVEAEFINTGWDGIIPALNAERFDVIMSAMTITEERAEVIDFIAYVMAGVGILVQDGNPEGVQTLDDLAGKTVAVQEGTIQVDIVEAKNEELEAAGEPIIELLRFGTDPEAIDQLRVGRAAAVLNDSPVAAYAAAQNPGDFDLLETLIDPAPYGIGVRKGSPELRQALQDALAAIKASGEFDSIMEKWEPHGTTAVE